MITELRSQRNAILSAKDDIDQRARFTEAVLSGVSAAVLGVDGDGRITIANKAASPLLSGRFRSGRNIAEAMPELAPVFHNARQSRKHDWREQVTITRDGQERTLNVQVTQERDDVGRHSGSEDSFVITIDDITDLVAAQRNTAWSDVARRIAHRDTPFLEGAQVIARRRRRQPHELRRLRRRERLAGIQLGDDPLPGRVGQGAQGARVLDPQLGASGRAGGRHTAHRNSCFITVK